MLGMLHNRIFHSLNRNDARYLSREVFSEPESNKMVKREEYSYSGYDNIM